MTPIMLDAFPQTGKLPQAERARLAQVARRKRLKKGETLFQAGQPCDTVWVVESGRMQLLSFSDGGRSSSRCLIGPREFFCCLPALDGGPYPADAVASVESTVIGFPRESFVRAMRAVPAFGEAITCLFCQRLRGMEAQGCLAVESVEKRVAEVLISLSRRFGASLPVTRQEVADLAGTTVETCIRVVSRFRERGWVAASRGKLTLRNPQKLREAFSLPA